MKSLPTLAIVVPCYNEESVLPDSLTKLLNLLEYLIKNAQVSTDSFIYCVDDGSCDQTWNIINNAHQNNIHVKGMRLGRNAGHQNALIAGMMNIKQHVDCVITIDADLQDDINSIPEMLDHFAQGSEIVLGVRKQRQKDTWFKRLSANFYYKLMQRSGSDLINNHADFRLMSKRALEQLEHFTERNIFLRGLVTLIGFKTTIVYYDRASRLYGETKYPLRKMIKFAWDGMISFSHIPLDFILIAGVISFILSIAGIFYVLFAKFFSQTVPGWASIMIPLTFIGGVQLLSIGIIGEYLAKIYMEVKGRPRYIKDIELF